MKIIYALSLCALLSLNAFAQAENGDAETNIEQIQLTRAADSSGAVDESTTVFTTNDVPIYCSVALRSSGKTAVVKMIFIAVSAAGLKPNSVVVSVNYKMSGRETGVNFDASPAGKTWAAGKYRVDVFLDGKTAKSLEFEIKSAANDAKKEKPAPARPKSKPKRAQNLKSKISRRADWQTARKFAIIYKTFKGEKFHYG